MASASKHFDGDLADGQLGEGSFGELLRADGRYWEHKRDYQCCTTGNVAIEYETSELPSGGGRTWKSGIAVSFDGWWIVEFGGSGVRLVTPLNTAKRLARIAVLDGRQKWIGDDSRFHNALVPAAWFWVVAARDYVDARRLATVSEGWMERLPTKRQAVEYAETGKFEPDAEGWAA